MSAPNLDTPTELLTPDRAAAFLGTTPGTLQTWRCTRAVKIPFVKIGRCVRYRRRDLEEYVLDNLIGGVE